MAVLITALVSLAGTPAAQPLSCRIVSVSPPSGSIHVADDVEATVEISNASHQSIRLGVRINAGHGAVYTLLNLFLHHGDVEAERRAGNPIFVISSGSSRPPEAPDVMHSIPPQGAIRLNPRVWMPVRRPGPLHLVVTYNAFAPKENQDPRYTRTMRGAYGGSFACRKTVTVASDPGPALVERDEKVESFLTDRSVSAKGRAKKLASLLRAPHWSTGMDYFSFVLLEKVYRSLAYPIEVRQEAARLLSHSVSKRRWIDFLDALRAIGNDEFTPLATRQIIARNLRDAVADAQSPFHKPLSADEVEKIRAALEAMPPQVRRGLAGTRERQ